MKTLLSKKQIAKYHKGDNHSARTTVKEGTLFYKRGLGFLECKDVLVFRIDTCPHCKGSNTFHKRENRENGIDNVYNGVTSKSKYSVVYHKMDYCLDCHKPFSIELFCYKRLSLLEGIKKTWFKK